MVLETVLETGHPEYSSSRKLLQLLTRDACHRILLIDNVGTRVECHVLRVSCHVMWRSTLWYLWPLLALNHCMAKGRSGAITREPAVRKGKQSMVAQHFAGPGLATADDCDDGEKES